MQDEILTFPLLALASIIPQPSTGTALAVPEHFLSQVILDLEQSPFLHLQSTSHLHFFLPNGMVTAARLVALCKEDIMCYIYSTYYHTDVILSRLCDSMYHVCVILYLRQVLDTEKNIWQMCSLLVLATQGVYIPKIHFQLFLET